MEHIVVNTPSRLHFGLIDMNGDIGRIDGGIGLALETPQTTIEVEKSDSVRVACESEPAMVDRLQTAIANVCGHFKVPGATINVLERPLPHVGLGSATQTFLGAAHGVCRLYDIEATSLELAYLVGRGGTSGIGVAAVQTGGFIIDGGHPFRRDENSKHGYTPSSASSGMKPPPVLVRYDFPDWDVLVVVPLGEGASGLREITLFKVVCPIPLDQVRQMCHIILMQMLPAVLEKDLEAFGRSMVDFQKLGFKVFELRAQTQLLHDCLRFLTDNGGVGVGMSSWGPAVFAFGENLLPLKEKVDDWLDGHGGGESVLTKANNVGMHSKMEDV
ncbi:MAG: beta-ribofuranosylaminobenzene 5'-phosphate synthase [Proteobacteria bacterium]|nr:beta-ribofuranosylaminobenzene 5'-phosphate synthase [Pseudomonadota bacterium]